MARIDLQKNATRVGVSLGSCRDTGSRLFVAPKRENYKLVNRLERHELSLAIFCRGGIRRAILACKSRPRKIAGASCGEGRRRLCAQAGGAFIWYISLPEIDGRERKAARKAFWR